LVQWDTCAFTDVHEKKAIMQYRMNGFIIFMSTCTGVLNRYKLYSDTIKRKGEFV
jgi:hypothetical protein